MRTLALMTVLLASLAAAGCQGSGALLGGWVGTDPDPQPPEPIELVVEPIDPAVYERAQAERSEFFEREVERLRADLRQAEDSIVALESGLRGAHTKADAVSAVAEARIALDSVGRSVPWRSDRVEEARNKLEEANHQLAADHVGAAVFFASRAQRIIDSLRAEAKQVALWDDRRVIRGERVNLRSGPSESAHIVDVLDREMPVYPERALADWSLVRTPDGRVGWVHDSLLTRP